MAGVEQDVASRVIAHTFEKHFEGRAVVQIFAGMNLKTKIDSRNVKCIENRLPASRQFVEGCLDQSGRALRPGINVRPRERSGKCSMRAQPEISGSLRGVLQLLHSPSLSRARIPLHGIRRKAVKRDVIRGMHRDELPLQVRRQLRQLQAVARQSAGYFVAISFALRRSLQIEEAAIPRRNLHTFVAESSRPVRDALQIVEWSLVACKLRQKYRWPFYSLHPPELLKVESCILICFAS